MKTSPLQTELEATYTFEGSLTENKGFHYNSVATRNHQTLLFITCKKFDLSGDMGLILKYSSIYFLLLLFTCSKRDPASDLPIHNGCWI